MVSLFMRVVALYCRISFDRHGRAEGVEDQEKWGREYAGRTWPGVPVEVFVDNDISATNRKVPRPDFDRLRQWIEDGRVAHIWSVEQSRLTRDEIEWFTLAADLDDAGIGEIHTNRDGVVRVRDDVAGIKAVINAGEIRKMKARLADSLAEEAARGVPPTVRPFGYKITKTSKGVRTFEEVPEEADALRWASDAFLSGWSLQSIAAELRKRGLHGSHRVKVRDPQTGLVVIDPETDKPAVRPSVITGNTVRQMLTNPSVAGLRVFKGELVGKGNWEPIISETARQQILARIGSVRHVRNVKGELQHVNPLVVSQKGGTRRSRRKYLLTGGVAVCGVCNARLGAANRKFRTGSGPYYFCQKALGGKGCVGIAAEPLERYVKERLFAELAKPSFLETFNSDEHAEERERLATEISALGAKRSELARLWSTDGIGLEEWSLARAGLDEREQSLRMSLAAVPPPVETFDVEALKDPRAWGAMNLGERREWIEMFVKSVTILRAKPPFQKIDLEARVKIEWK